MVDPDSMSARVARSIWIAWVFVAVGLLGLLFALVLWWRTRQFVAHAVHTRAVIVDFHVYSPSGRTHHPMYRPVFRFVDAAAKTWQAESGTSDYPPAYQVGQRVGIVYPPENPSRARMDTVSGVWADSLAAGVIGGFALLLGLGMVAAMHIVAGRRWTAAPWWDQWFVPLKLALRLLFR